MRDVLGTCSLCGGAVVIPEGSMHREAVCEGCGATLLIIPMERPERPQGVPGYWPPRYDIRGRQLTRK